MQHRTREQAFLARLWELQAEAALNDAALARVVGVSSSNISRAKRRAHQTVSVKFMLAACDRFPELVFLLFPDLRIRNGSDQIRIGKGAA